MSYTHAGYYVEGLLNSVGTTSQFLRNTAVNVYTVGTTTPTTLYLNRNRSAGTNPVNTDLNGNLAFYAEPGQYDLVFTPLGGLQQRITITVQPDPADYSATYKPLITAPTVAMTGDSITSFGNVAASGVTVQQWNSRSILMQTVLQSQGKLRFGGAVGVSGYTSAQVLATNVPQILALSPRPTYCIVLCGTNDGIPSTLTNGTPNATQSNLNAIYDALQAGLNSWATDIPNAATFTQEFIVPAGMSTNNNRFRVSALAAGGTVSVGQFTVIDLDAQAINT